MQNKVKREEKAKKEEEEKKVATGKENKKMEKKNKKTKVGKQIVFLSYALVNGNLQADLVDESKWPSCELWKEQSHKRCVKCSGKKSL